MSVGKRDGFLVATSRLVFMMRENTISKMTSALSDGRTEYGPHLVADGECMCADDRVTVFEYFTSASGRRKPDTWRQESLSR